MSRQIRIDLFLISQYVMTQGVEEQESHTVIKITLKNNEQGDGWGTIPNRFHFVPYICGGFNGKQQCN